MEELPNVFQNPINKSFKNVQESFCSSDRKALNYSYKDIEKKINEIFGSLNHVYKSHVRITFKDGELIDDVVGKNKDYLLMISGKTIKISDILDIEKI